VCINKADLYPAGTAAIDAACFERGIDVIGHIPFDSTVTAAIVQGEPMTVHRPEAPASRALKNIWQRIATHLNGAGERRGTIRNKCAS
jgi:MinD superfamily P-loop ATPase